LFCPAPTFFNLSELKNRLPQPVPATWDEIVPDRSAELVVENSDAPDLFVGVGEARPIFVPVRSSIFDPPFPKNVRLYRVMFWEKVYTRRIEPPHDFKREITHATGTTIEDSATFAAELGIPLGELSLKLSASFSYQVTMTDSLSVTESISFSVPADRRIVFTVWSQTECFEFRDPEGRLPRWSSRLQSVISRPGGKFTISERVYLPKLAILSKGKDLAFLKTPFPL
jgi:hypothetical protein